MNNAEEPNVQELARCLSKNVPLFRELLTGPKHKAELADALGVSKSTVYYRFEQLKEYHLVTRNADGYQVTIVGRYLAETYLDTLEAMKTLCEAGRLIPELSADVAPPRDALADAYIVLPDGHPEQLWTEFYEWVLATDTVRAMMPRISCTLLDRIHERVQKDELALEITLPPGATTYLAENRPEKFRSIVQSESVIVHKTTGLPTYGLVLVDEPRHEVGLLVYTETGYLGGFIRFDSESSWQWADDLFTMSADERRPYAIPTEETAK